MDDPDDVLRNFDQEGADGGRGVFDAVDDRPEYLLDVGLHVLQAQDDVVRDADDNALNRHSCALDLVPEVLQATQHPAQLHPARLVSLQLIDEQQRVRRRHGRQQAVAVEVYTERLTAR